MVTIIMPVYNGEKYLNQSIESILNQSFNKFEFLILNDGSTDKSLEIINSYNDKRIKVINKKNEGISKTLNFGIINAKYEYIARMDCDDIAHKDRLKIQIDFLNKFNDVVLLGGSANEIDENNNFLSYRKVETDENKINNKLPFTSFIHPTVIFRKSVALKTNLYPIEINRGEDSIFFNSISKHGRICNISDILIDYRISRYALSDRDKNSQKTINKVVNFYAKHDYLSEELFFEFSRIKKNNSRKNKSFNYYRYLAINFTLKNYNPKIALENIFKCIYIKRSIFFKEFFILPILLLIKPKASNLIIQKIASKNFKRK